MKTVVMSLGGSLIAQDWINSSYLKKFSKLINSLVRKGFKFVIVAGGGLPSRKYMSALRNSGFSEIECSHAGILVTKLNAFVVSKYLRTKSPVPGKISDVNKFLKKYKVVVCGGFKPNMTSDGDAANIARMLKTRVLFNLTNVDGLFDKDPNKFGSAKLIRNISSHEFLKIMKRIGHEAGQHFVLDLEAAEVCKKGRIKVFILNGLKLNNFSSCLSGKSFKGTTIY